VVCRGFWSFFFRTHGSWCRADQEIRPRRVASPVCPEWLPGCTAIVRGGDAPGMTPRPTCGSGAASERLATSSFRRLGVDAPWAPFSFRMARRRFQVFDAFPANSPQSTGIRCGAVSSPPSRIFRTRGLNPSLRRVRPGITDGLPRQSRPAYESGLERAQELRFRSCLRAWRQAP